MTVKDLHKGHFIRIKNSINHKSIYEVESTWGFYIETRDILTKKLQRFTKSYLDYNQIEVIQPGILTDLLYGE